MAIYTVHEPPITAREEKRGPERFAFVRDGFYFWAFLLAPVWMIYRRLWLALLLYVVAAIALSVGLKFYGVGNFAMAFVQVLLSMLVGLEAATLQRRKLAWWGWRDLGTVSGKPLEEAERRFFTAWGARDVAQPAAAAASVNAAFAPAPAYATYRQDQSQGAGIVGLFPEPPR